MDQLSGGAKELRRILVGPSNDSSWKTWTFLLKKEFGKTRVEPDEFNYPLPVAVEDGEISDFFGKFIFAANTPNEYELTGILKKEVSQYFNLQDPDLESSHILNQMNNWFNNENNIWLSAKEGEKILKKAKKNIDYVNAFNLILIIAFVLCLKYSNSHPNQISLDYQQELNRIISFNPPAISVVADGSLKSFIESSNSPKKVHLMHFRTDFPEFTAAKVIDALKLISTDGEYKFQKDDDFLVTSSSRLPKGKEEKDSIRKAMLKKWNPYQFLVIVNDSDAPFQVVGPDNNSNALFSQREIPSISLNRKKIILIGKGSDEDSSTLSYEDSITYEQLSHKTKEDLLSKTISFQGSNATVRDLIGDGKTNEVLDLGSIKELLMTEDKERKMIPSYVASTFEKSLYINRNLTFDFDFGDTFWNDLVDDINKDTKNEPKTTAEELQKQCKINRETGTIDWIQGLEENVKDKIWQKIVETKNEKGKTSEDNLVNEINWGKRRAVVIKGVAGTGKSTVLSHYYDEIKKKDKNIWAIRIDLKDHFDALKKYKTKTKLSDAIDFFLHLPNVVDLKSPFARSLLKRRLETGDRVVLMLDGYDEIDGNCTKAAIQLMKVLISDKEKEAKPIRLYVTTRPDVADNLQFQLGQLAYTLVNFSEEDQYQYLTSFWTALIIKDIENKEIQNYAANFLDSNSPPITAREMEESVRNNLNSKEIETKILSVQEKDRIREIAWNPHLTKDFRLKNITSKAVECLND